MNYKVELQTKTELSYWELSHMINVLGNTYMKLTMLDEMQKLYNNGAADTDFIIGSKSLDLRTNIMELNTLIQLPREFEYTILDRKSNNADSFWETFNSLHRPIIMYKTLDGYKSLYNYENHLVFQEISTNSPQWLKTLGKGASIVIATAVFENIAGHYIDEFLFEDKDKIVIEQNERILEQNENILKNQELILLNQPIRNNEIDLTKEKTKQMIKNIQDFKEDTKIEYYDFIKIEKDKLEKKLKYQLVRTPLNIENILVV